jgi:surface antigen
MKKRVVCLAVAVLMLLALLTGCQTPGQKNVLNLKGAEAAKLLLAEERLNAQLLKNEGDIFENGAKVYRDLAAIAQANLYRYTYAETGVSPTTIAFDSAYPVVAPLGWGQATGKLSTVSKTESTDGSVLEIDGNTYTWSNFAEYSNSYDYFSNLTNNVVSSANAGADLIDNIKRFVRVVDKWVDMAGDEYYLHVEDNCEILFNRQGDFLRICKRSRDEQGVDVYELYRADERSETRMTYIPGRKYEYTHREKNGGFNHNIIAENTKGYWEFLDVGGEAPHYNVSCIVIKDDICYQAPYSLEDIVEGVGRIQIISPDRASDIMDCDSLATNSRCYITLSLQSFEGVESIQMEVDPDRVLPANSGTGDIYVHEEHGKKFYMAIGAKSPDVILKNGMVLKSGDRYLDDRVEMREVRVDYRNKENGTYGYWPMMSFMIDADTFEARVQTLREFLSLTGLTCKWDMDYVISGTVQALKEVEQSQKYQTWNESPIRTSADITQGFANLDAKYVAWHTLYGTVKDAERIEFTDREAMELNAYFAPIATQTATAVKSEGLEVSVSGLSLTVTDTTLLVEGDVYMVNFALLGKAAGGLVHIPVEGTQTATYDGGDELVVTQTATFTIPALSPDEYTVVTYISTPEGIRMSGYTALVFGEVMPCEAQAANVAVKTSRGAANELKVVCTYVTNVEVTLAFESEEVSYEDMYAALAEAAYQYGFVDESAAVELLSGEDTWTALAGEEAALTAGTYRLKYQIRNRDSLVEGYVIAQYGK